MATAKVELPNGTKVEIDGTIDEIARLLHGYGGAPTPAPAPVTAPLNGSDGGKVTAKPRRRVGVRGGSPKVEGEGGVDIPKIVELIKECDEAEKIEEKVLNQRGVLNRILLPLWIVGKYIDPELGLTSGDASKVTDQLGVKVTVPGASTALSDQAKSYVTADSVRKRGAVVRYRLNRRGYQYFEEVLK